PQANGLHLSRSGYSEKQRRRLCRSPRERRPKEQTTDATGTAVLESQFRGCSQALLYNTDRPTLIDRISAAGAANIHRPAAKPRSACTHPVVSIRLVQNIRQVSSGERLRVGSGVG